MNADAYYQPPEPIADYEADLGCDKCERDTTHRITAWIRLTSEAECTECGNVTELEPDDE